MIEGIDKSWKKILDKELKKPYITELDYFVEKEYESGVIYPEKKNIFKAFSLCSPLKTKVVILGQDPYHGPRQANGLCFSVEKNISLPPSLKNIYKEIESDLKLRINKGGDLAYLAKQGVLLLNSTLTVSHKNPTSHEGRGWEKFTDEVIKKLSENKKHLVFILWGNYARKKKELIDCKKHLILEASHPSPFSAHKGFLGCKHFSKANKYLKKWGMGEIEWVD